MEAGWLGKESSAVNLLHMEEIAFHVESVVLLVSPRSDNDESQHAPHSLVSAYSFLFLRGRETANRHQGIEKALILSCCLIFFKKKIPFLVIFLPNN